MDNDDRERGSYFTRLQAGSLAATGFVAGRERLKNCPEQFFQILGEQVRVCLYKGTLLNVFRLILYPNSLF